MTDGSMAEPDRLPPRTARDRAVRALLALLVLALAAMWIYAWVFAPRGDPDRISDQAWADAAEARCAIASEVVTAVPVEQDDAQRRADDVDAVTGALAAMVDDLGATLPKDPDDADTVARWLDDYEIYLDDRREFSAGLREDPTTRFEVTAVENRQITAVIDRYADVNGMQSCMTPGDVT